MKLFRGQVVLGVLGLLLLTNVQVIHGQVVTGTILGTVRDSSGGVIAQVNVSARSAETGAVRKGERALYYWIYPNFMINYYDGVMDTNLVIPRGIDKTEVIFDFYFPDVTDAAARTRNRASIEVGHRIQDEDVSICKSVQRGLSSRAYNAGRLSVRREAGEHLFHRLLHADLKTGIEEQ